MSAALDLLRRHLRGALVALDFDGTLAPIVARPQDARPQEGVREVLLALLDAGAKVVVLTGRPALSAVTLGDLDRLPGLIVLGHYGMQRWADGALLSPAPDPRLEQVRAALPALLPPGATVEDKEHSVVVHVRGTPEPARAVALLRVPLTTLAINAGMECVPGRFVWELRPAGMDKGVALRALAAESSPAAVLVAGDDLGDLPMFAAARALGVPSWCVAVAGDDAPAEVAAAADLLLADPASLVAWLGGLVGS